MTPRDLEKEITEAEKMIADLKAELQATEAALAAGEELNIPIDEAVSKRIELQTRRDILRQRLDIAATLAASKRAELSILRSDEAQQRVRDLAPKVEKARGEVRQQIEEVLNNNNLQPFQAHAVNIVIDAAKTVSEVLGELETAQAREREASAIALNAQKAKAHAEQKSKRAMQQAVFDGNLDEIERK